MKIWKINGAELEVKDSSGCKEKGFDWNSDMVHADSIGQNEKVKVDGYMPYQSYRRKASSFWKDIPHHETKIRKKRPKAKGQMSKLIYKTMNSVLNVQQVKVHRKKRKRKKPSAVSNSVYDKYSSLTLVS